MRMRFKKWVCDKVKDYQGYNVACVLNMLKVIAQLLHIHNCRLMSKDVLSSGMCVVCQGAKKNPLFTTKTCIKVDRVTTNEK